MTRKALTDREVDVLAAVHEGLSNGDIAEALGTSPGSVSGACSSIRRKGYDIPRREHRIRDRATIAAANAAGRFTATGISNTGTRTTVTSDSQTFSDAHLAAMVAREKVPT